MNEKESIDRGFKHVSTIPCVYDLLNLESTGTWYDDGRIILNKPSIITKLDRIKFRSFSANIRSDIENLTSPSITGKLCGNFTFYNKPGNTFDPPKTVTSDVVDGTEIGIVPTISDMSVQIYNQSGYQQYQAANGIYQNGVNNEVTFSEFNVPLVTSFDDSINDMLNYAKYNFVKLMGLFDDSAKNENLYNTSTFVYGEVNTKPYVPELGSYKWINSAHNLSSNFNVEALKLYGLTYDEGVLDPPLEFGGYQYNQGIMNPKVDVSAWGMYAPIGFIRTFVPVRQVLNYFVLGLAPSALTEESKPKVSSPYIDLTTLPRLVNPFNKSKTLNVAVGALGTSQNMCLTGSIYQNGNNYIMSLYSFDEGAGGDIANLKERLSFNYIYRNYASNMGAMFHSVISHNGVSKVLTFDNLPTNNLTSDFDSEIASMQDDGYYLLTYNVIDYTESLEGNDWRVYILLVFTNGIYLKILRFEIDAATWGGSGPSFDTNVTFPKAKEIHRIRLPKKFAYIDNDWNESNYLEFLNDLNNVNTPNSLIMILPKYTDGSNDALQIHYYDDEEGVIKFEFYLLEESAQGGNIWYSNNTLYTSRYVNEANAEPKAEISMCRTINVILDDSGEHMNIGVAGSIVLENYVYLSWWPNRYERYGRDITSYVEKYNLKFPLVNAISSFEFDKTIITENTKQPTNETDSLVWLIDATGAQAYIKNQSFENIYSFAQSAFTVSFNLKETEGTGGPVQLYPAIPDISEPTGISATSYSWVNDKHITQTLANPYFYAAESSFSFLDNAFKVDNDGNITFPCIPVVSSNGKYNGLFTFFVKFETTPAIITFDPNVRQSERFANRYNYCKQFLNKTPSLYNDKYPFNDYIYYNNRELFDKIGVYLNLQNTDLTLKLVVSGYPSINSILFYLNEESLVDFKEMSTSPFVNTIECTLVDSNGETLTPSLAANIYRNITISADWTFFS